MEDCCIGTHMAVCFAAFLPITYIWHFSPCYLSQLPTPCSPSPIFPQKTPVCSAPLPVSMCSPCSYLPMSENIKCLIFCSCVSLLRTMVCRFIHVPTKNTHSSILWPHSIPWCICATFSLSSLSWMAFGLVPGLCYCKQCCNEHLCACVLTVE